MTDQPRTSRTAQGGRGLLPDAVMKFVEAYPGAQDDIERRLREETALLPMGGMQVGRAEGALLGLLVATLGATNVVEIGTFTGYSALCMARGLPDGGRLLCCDTSEEWTGIAQRYWKEAGVADRIDLRLAPALETLSGLPADSIDLAFVDADKENYSTYYERLMQLVRPNGLILFDNMLARGNAVAPPEGDSFALSVRAASDRIMADPRADAVLLPVGDGVTLVRRKP